MYGNKKLPSPENGKNNNNKTTCEHGFHHRAYSDHPVWSQNFIFHKTYSDSMEIALGFTFISIN